MIMMLQKLATLLMATFKPAERVLILRICLPLARALHLWLSFFPLALTEQILQLGTFSRRTGLRSACSTADIFMMISTIPAKSRLLTATKVMLKRTKRIWKNSLLPSAITDSVVNLSGGIINNY